MGVREQMPAILSATAATMHYPPRVFSGDVSHICQRLLRVSLLSKSNDYLGEDGNNESDVGLIRGIVAIHKPNVEQPSSLSPEITPCRVLVSHRHSGNGET